MNALEEAAAKWRALPESHSARLMIGGGNGGIRAVLELLEAASAEPKPHPAEWMLAYVLTEMERLARLLIDWQGRIEMHTSTTDAMHDLLALRSEAQAAYDREVAK